MVEWWNGGETVEWCRNGGVVEEWWSGGGMVKWWMNGGVVEK